MATMTKDEFKAIVTEEKAIIQKINSVGNELSWEEYSKVRSRLTEVFNAQADLFESLGSDAAIDEYMDYAKDSV